ncbi:hypothetical protein KM043_016498 [Ampulex compressa]|nr:hypothetical protein KM043_016498 [Ampulex compressa]
MMVKEEELAIVRGGIRFMNQHLMAVLPNNRSLEAVKGARHAAAYKKLVEAALREIMAGSISTNSDSSFHSAHEKPLEDLRSQDVAGLRPSPSPTRTLPSPAAQSLDILHCNFRLAIGGPFVQRSVPSNVGYEIEGSGLNTLAYADNNILIVSTKNGPDTSL